MNFNFFLGGPKTIFDYIKEGDVEKMKECVEKGTKINDHEKTKDKFTPLHTAVFYGSLEVRKQSFLELKKV